MAGELVAKVWVAAADGAQTFRGNGGIKRIAVRTADGSGNNVGLSILDSDDDPTLMKTYVEDGAYTIELGHAKWTITAVGSAEFMIF